MKAIAPGKLILSGEHAVVYGKPALAIAIDRYAETTVIPQTVEMISFDFLNFNHCNSVTLNTLREVKKRLIEQYKLFSCGKCSIREVIQKPFELAQFAFIHLLDHYNIKLKSGLKLIINSAIPVGCGMGSSAAIILSMLRAITNYNNIELTYENYLDLGREAEKLQHGISSGLDLAVSLHGGGIYFCDGAIQVVSVSNINLYAANTGIPQVTTGESISEVTKHFTKSIICGGFCRDN